MALRTTWPAGPRTAKLDAVVMEACSSVMSVAPRSLKDMSRKTPATCRPKIGAAATRTPTAMPPMAKQRSNGDLAMLLIRAFPRPVQVDPTAKMVPMISPTAKITPMMARTPLECVEEEDRTYAQVVPDGEGLDAEGAADHPVDPGRGELGGGVVVVREAD